MNKLWLYLQRTAMAATLGIVLSACSASKTGSELVGKHAPLTRVQMMDGRYLPLDEFRGKTVVMTFWATWCSRSNKLLSELGRLSQQAGPQVVFLNVSVDPAEQLEKVQTRLRDPALAGTLNAFSGNAEYDEAYMSFRCNELPRVFVIDPAGVVVSTSDDAESVRAALGLQS